MLLRLGEVEALYFYQNTWLREIPKEFNDSTKCSVLFHGYGANAWDLAPLANYFQQLYPSRTDLLWIFPQGFIELGYGNSEQSSRAWFPIPLERLMMRNFQSADFMNEQKIEKRENLLTILTNYFHLLQNKNVKNLYLGGFSQGGMVAYHLLPKILEYFSLDLLTLFSTVGIEKTGYQADWDKIKQQSLPKFIQSHGKADELLSFSDAKNLHHYLQKFFLKSDFFEFNQGHALPDNIIREYFNNL